MIEFHNAGKAYGGHWAVRGLDLAVPEGEIFGLLGPNGAGKTTAIRMMTGLIRPSEGRISICGHDIVSDPISAKAATGYVPDKSFLYERLTGREFLSFVASLYGVDQEASAEAIVRLTALMGIAEVGGELIMSYSHGMRQRLLFCAAMIHSPRVLIIDEPFVGLDPFGVRTLTGLMKELSAGRVSVFLATHSLHIAQEICTRVGIIQKGRLAAIIEKQDFSSHGGGLEETFMAITS